MKSDMPQELFNKNIVYVNQGMPYIWTLDWSTHVKVDQDNRMEIWFGNRHIGVMEGRFVGEYATLEEAKFKEQELIDLLIISEIHE